MGFAAGLQAGERLGQGILDAYNQSREQRGIREAKGLTAKEIEQREATPDEINRARAEAQAMAAQDAEVFGLTPQEQVNYAPQMPVQGQRIGLNRYQVGQQMFDRMPTQAEIERAREYAIADVIAERDPARALQMRRELRDQEFQEKQRPLLLQQLEGALRLQGVQTEGAEINLRGARRTDDAAVREENFTKFASQNPDMSVADLKAAAFKEFGYSPQQWEKAVTSRLNIDTAEMGIFKKNIQAKLKGKNLGQVGELYNTDPDFDDKTDLAIVPGKAGAVTLNFIDKATKKITGTQTFKNEALALEYLNKQATEPENLGTWMLNLAKVEAAIDASAASATKDRAIGAAYGIEKTKPFDPEKYAKTVKAFTDSGMSLVDARVQADQMYGRGPKDTVDADLQEQNKNKGKPTTATDKKTTPEMSQAQARLQIFDDTIARLRQNTGLANPNRAQNAAALAILEQQRAELRDSLRIGGTYNEDVGLRTMPMARP